MFSALCSPSTKPRHWRLSSTCCLLRIMWFRLIGILNIKQLSQAGRCWRCALIMYVRVRSFSGFLIHLKTISELKVQLAIIVWVCVCCVCTEHKSESFWKLTPRRASVAGTKPTARRQPGNNPARNDHRYTNWVIQPSWLRLCGPFASDDNNSDPEWLIECLDKMLKYGLLVYYKIAVCHFYWVVKYVFHSNVVTNQFINPFDSFICYYFPPESSSRCHIKMQNVEEI